MRQKSLSFATLEMALHSDHSCDGHDIVHVEFQVRGGHENIGSFCDGRANCHLQVKDSQFASEKWKERIDEEEPWTKDTSVI
jgi:hypothetical protein